MTHDEIIELLGAYALDAVDDTERAAVEEHLPVCPRCRSEVEEYREVAAIMSHGGGDAPQGVWRRIADSLEEAPPKLGLAPLQAAPRPEHTTRSRSRWVATVATAAAVVLIAVLGVQVRQQSNRIDQLQVAQEEPLAPAFEAALEAPSSRRLELRSPDGTLVVHGVITLDGFGYLGASELPGLDAASTYQLWGTVGGRVVSLGVLGPTPRIFPFRGEPYTSFAITREEAPGVVQSRQEPVVSGELS